MTVLLVLGIVAAGWCLLTLPLAVAIGRAFHAGEVDERDEGALALPGTCDDQAAAI